MNMDNAVLLTLVTGGCTLAASVLTALITLRGKRKEEKISSLEEKLDTRTHQLLNALKSIDCFYELERKYITEISSSKNMSEETVKLRIRKEVRDMGLNLLTDGQVAVKRQIEIIEAKRVSY